MLFVNGVFELNILLHHEERLLEETRLVYWSIMRESFVYVCVRKLRWGYVIIELLKDFFGCYKKYSEVGG